MFVDFVSDFCLSLLNDLQILLSCGFPVVLPEEDGVAGASGGWWIV